MLEITREEDLQTLDGKLAAATQPPLTTASDLYLGVSKPQRVILSSLLYGGLTMLIARPKAGKSWLTLQLAIAIAGGRGVDGVDVAEFGPVLYVALEEPKSRTESRLRKITPSGEWAARLHFAYDLLPLQGGGAEQIENYIRQVNAGVVIVDTLTAALKMGVKQNSDVFRSQYAEVSRLRKIAEDCNVALIVVHHTRKGASDSPVDAVAGTGGVSAAVDCLWLLKRKSDGDATLEITGRETEEKTLALKLREDQDEFGWAVLGDDATLLLNSERKEVLELLRDEGGLTPAQIAAEVGKTRPAVRMLLKRMRYDGQVRKDGTKYLPTLTMSYSVTSESKDL